MFFLAIATAISKTVRCLSVGACSFVINERVYHSPSVVTPPVSRISFISQHVRQCIDGFTNLYLLVLGLSLITSDPFAASSFIVLGPAPLQHTDMCSLMRERDLSDPLPV